MKNLYDLHTEAMVDMILKCSDEIIAEIFEIERLNETDKVFLKTIALTELTAMILENYFELFNENRGLKRKLEEKNNLEKAL